MSGVLSCTDIDSVQLWTTNNDKRRPVIDIINSIVHNIWVRLCFAWVTLTILIKTFHPSPVFFYAKKFIMQQIMTILINDRKLRNYVFGILQQFWIDKQRTQRTWRQTCAASLMAMSMWPTWGPSGADRTQVGPMLAPWTLLCGTCSMYIVFLLIYRKWPRFYTSDMAMMRWHTNTSIQLSKKKHESLPNSIKPGVESRMNTCNIREFFISSHHVLV